MHWRLSPIAQNIACNSVFLLDEHREKSIRRWDKTEPVSQNLGSTSIHVELNHDVPKRWWKIVQQFLFYIVEESSHIFFKLLPKCLNIMYFWNYVFALMLDETLNFQGKRKLDRQYMKFILFPTVHIFMSKAVKESKRKIDSKRYTIFFFYSYIFLFMLVEVQSCQMFNVSSRHLPNNVSPIVFSTLPFWFFNWMFNLIMY